MNTLSKHVFLIIVFTLTSGVLLAQTVLPIKPTRTISFTTDEGTHMNVDVSPDGKTLVFDLLGDLYTIPSVGGKAMQITRGIAINSRPKWSPDGKKIAYWSDTSGSVHVNVIDLKRTFHVVLGKNENEQMCARDSDFVWTPDGNSIVIGAAIYSLSGSKIPTDSTTKWPLGFSSDGNIVYSLEWKGGYKNLQLQERIVRYDRQSKVYTALSPFITAQSFRFQGVLSPDERRCCYYADSNGNRCLMISDFMNNETRMLVPRLLVQDPRYFNVLGFPHFSFSPDSRHIFLGYAGKIHRIEVENGKDVIIPFSADVKSDLGPLNYNTFKISDDPEQSKYIRSVNASPDGKHLIFSALGKVCVMDLPNGKPRILVDQPFNQFQPVYSPDGQWIAYVTWCDNVGGHLWRVPTSGGNPEQLTHLASEFLYPAWSPDGTRLAVVKATPNFHISEFYRRDIGQVEIVSLKENTVRVVADSVPVLNGLSFSSDGRQIIYTPKQRAILGPYVQSKLVSKTLDGGDLHAVAFGENIPQDQQKVVSPDGRYIVYSMAEDLFLAPMALMKDSLVLLRKNRNGPTVRFATGVDPHWEKNGKVLAWSYGNHFYRVDPDKIIALVKNLKIDQAPKPKKGKPDFITVLVKPDEIISIPLPVPKHYAHGIIALKNVRIISMRGNEVIEKGTIIIKDRRISAVGPSSTTIIPKGVKVLDLTGSTVMPGLVDLHYHMGALSNIIPQQYWSLQAALAYGTTTIRDPAQHLTSYGIAEMLNAGLMTGPRLYTVGEPALLPQVISMDSLQDAQRLVQKRQQMGSVVIKNYLTTETRMQKEWLHIACQQSGLNMTNERGTSLIESLAMLKDGNTGIEHNPAWEDVYKDVLTVFAKSGTYFTPTLQVMSGPDLGDGQTYFNYQYWRHPDEKFRHFSFSDPKGKPVPNGSESIEALTQDVPPEEGVISSLFIASVVDARIRHLGGRVTLGSHGNEGGIGPHNELWALQLGGLTNMEALQAGSIMGAEALGLQKDLGSLEVGKIADLIILNKNPLDDIHNSREIRYVMKDGILYDGNNLDEIWPEKKKCPDWRQPIDMKATSPPPPPSAPMVVISGRH